MTMEKPNHLNPFESYMLRCIDFPTNTVDFPLPCQSSEGSNHGNNNIMPKSTKE